jgi:D-alanyl-D-alanine dipeptidase
MLIISLTGCSKPIDMEIPKLESLPVCNVEIKKEPVLIPELTIPLAPIGEEEVEVIPEVEPLDSDLVEIQKYIPNIVIDLKYATTDNFTGVIIYDNISAQLRYGTLKKLIRVQELLNDLGYTLVIWDAYRPIDAQFKLWEVCPNSKYVANPHKGFSSHSRGNTIDITIQKLSGESVEMPTEFDDFSKLADRDYSDISKEAKKNSQLLEEVMKDCGFKPYSAEWWHFTDTIGYDVVK